MMFIFDTLINIAAEASDVPAVPELAHHRQEHGQDVQHRFYGK